MAAVTLGRQKNVFLWNSKPHGGVSFLSHPLSSRGCHFWHKNLPPYVLLRRAQSHKHYRWKLELCLKSVLRGTQVLQNPRVEPIILSFSKFRNILTTISVICLGNRKTEKFNPPGSNRYTSGPNMSGNWSLKYPEEIFLFTKNWVLAV